LLGEYQDLSLHFPAKRSLVIDKWYFAYGSNMRTSRLEERVKRANVGWQAGFLQDYALSFDKPARDGTGYAMILPQSGERVYGVIYFLKNSEIDLLDAHEGVPNHYIRQALPIVTLSSRIIDAEVYLPSQTTTGLRPRRTYLEHLTKGAREHGLPLEYCLFLEALKSVP
jgi:gamma-glutamylcyclotransferase